MRKNAYRDRQGSRSLSPALVILVAIGLALVIFSIVWMRQERPELILDWREGSVAVSNPGKADARIYRFEAFLYEHGEISYITNMPAVEQIIDHAAVHQPLPLPKIPPPPMMGGIRGPVYLRLVVRYTPADVSVSRFKTDLVLRYDPKDAAWRPCDRIPVRYKGLGKSGIGEIHMITLDFSP